MSKLPDGFASVYAAELLCQSTPTLSRQALLSAIRVRLPQVQPLDKNDKSDLLAFIHPQHLVTYKEGAVPAQTFFTVSDKPPKVDFLVESVQQSWAFPEAASVVSKCNATVFVSDLLSSGLAYQQRLGLFQDVLLAVISVVKCEGVHLHASRQILHPNRIVELLSESPPPSYAAGAINIRMFNINNAGPGEMVMDSLGLAALGLCDVQCHFKQIDPNSVARVLYNIAAYLFEQGDVIEDGHTVEGATPGSKWRCRHEDALVPPARVVLDLDPGPSFAARGRNN